MNVDASRAATLDEGEGDVRLHEGKSNPCYEDIVAVPVAVAINIGRNTQALTPKR